LRGLPVIVASAAIYLVWTQIAGYGANLIRNRNWVSHVEVQTLSALDAAVFKRLVDNGMIWAERRPGIVLLQHTPCTTATRLAPGTAVVRGTPTENQRRQLIELLCRSPQGEFIQNEVEAWNLSYELLAIRDNRYVNLPTIRPVAARRTAGLQRDNNPTPTASAAARTCMNSNVVARFFVPPHCYENTWEALYADGIVRATALTSPNAEPPPRDYAFLAAEGITYPGDWRTFTPFGDTRLRGNAAPSLGLYELTTDIALGSEPVVIQVVGEVFDIRIGSADWPRRFPVPKTAPVPLTPQKSQAAGVNVELDLLCHSWVESSDPNICLTGAAREETSAYEVTLTTAARRNEMVRVGLRVLPRLVPAEELTGLNDNEMVTLHRATNIRAECAGPHPIAAAATVGGQAPEPGACSLTWLESNSVEQRGEVNAQVFMRTGDTPLTDPKGVLTDAAFGAGMAEIVGLGPTTFGSLAQGLVRAPGLGRPVRLTIDPDLQRQAREVLSEYIRCNPHSRRANPGACEEATRGTLVVMDADSGQTGGEILAAASWPQMSRGLGAWDLSALDAGEPSESPIAGNGWRAHDISSMAGSTFKAVTSLAALQRELDTGDTALSGILLGTMPINELERDLRIRRAENGWRTGPCDSTTPAPPGTGNAVVVLNSQGHVIRCIGNARESQTVGLLPGSIATYRHFCGDLPANRFGLCEALAMSSNLYFSGLELYLDSPRLQQRPEPTSALPDLSIARMARRLLPDGLGEDAPPTARRRDFPLVRGLSLRAPRLGVSPFILPAEAARKDSTNGPRQLDLALNGIGQAVTATPVAMATVYASLGSRTIIRPTLVRLDTPRDQRGDPLEGQPVLTVPPGRQADYEKLMAQISRGLNGVTAVGTAACHPPQHCPFQWSSLPPGLRNSIFVKTGTATLSEEGENTVYSAWVVGWVDPPRDIPSGITRRIAIACNVARTRDFGAAACAPIVGELIRQLHARQQ
jgi:cell division protein FtsI/penicillin-binding protein 2